VAGGIYLDYAATSPVDPRVVTAMLTCLDANGDFANPSSTSHVAGRRARARVELARYQVGALLNAESAAIVWTSGATEADNLAILGAARGNRDRGNHLITARSEHRAVLDPCRRLEREGFEVTYLTPDRAGLIHPEQVREALRSSTTLVSLMLVNNEIGVVQDIAAMGRICTEHRVLLHVDAAQAVGRCAIDVAALNVDLLSVTAHKVCGPKGVGALYVRRRPRPTLMPLLYGGGQEGGLRSGTLPTHQIVGMGEAFAIVAREAGPETTRIAGLRERLWRGLKAIGGVELNGHPTQRVAAILNASFAGVEGESLLLAAEELAVASGSACSSATREPSYVLRALGRDDVAAQASLRFSLGRFTTAAEIDRAVAVLTQAVPRLRELAPRQGGL
jgi:cysteine desulfurase